LSLQSSQLFFFCCRCFLVVIPEGDLLSTFAARTKSGAPMGLDIRIPLGLIFLLIGGLMSIYGLITRNAPDIYQKSMGINLNLTWGAIMFVFGLIMFLVGRRQRWQDDPVNPRPWEKRGPRS
jgi:hypothetical protein